MRLHSKSYFVTYVTLEGEIKSSIYGITQHTDEYDSDFLNLPEGLVARRLFGTIGDCKAIINFWFIKGEIIHV